MTTCGRFLRSMVKLWFTIITNDRHWHRPEPAALAGKSIIFRSFVAILAYIRGFRHAKAMAAWKCWGFWWTYGGTILGGTVAILGGFIFGQLSAEFPQTFLCEAITLVTEKIQSQHEGHKEAQHGDTSQEINWLIRKWCNDIWYKLWHNTLHSFTAF